MAVELDDELKLSIQKQFTKQEEGKRIGQRDRFFESSFLFTFCIWYFVICNILLWQLLFIYVYLNTN